MMPNVPAPLLFYFDFLSPFAYLASTQIEAVAARRGRQVDWRPVLVGVLVNQVMGMPSLPQIPLKGPYLRKDALRLAAWLDVPFAFHEVADVKSVTALRHFVLLKARDPRAAVAFAHAVFDRLWVRGDDISTAADLRPLLAMPEVDALDLESQMQSQQAKDGLRHEVDEAVSNGVFGVPFYRFDGESLWGADRLDMLAHWLTHGTWQRAPHDPSL